MSVSSMNFHYTHHLSTHRIEDDRFSSCVADSLQDRSLARVGSPDHEDAEVSKLCLYFLNLLSTELRFQVRSRHCEIDLMICERFKEGV